MSLCEKRQSDAGVRWQRSEHPRWAEAENSEDQAVVALLQGRYPPSFLQASGHFPSNAAQQAICLIGCDSALLVHLQPGIHRNPQILLEKAASHPVASQIVPTHGVILLDVYFSFLSVSVGPAIKFLNLTW